MPQIALAFATARMQVAGHTGAEEGAMHITMHITMTRVCSWQNRRVSPWALAAGLAAGLVVGLVAAALVPAVHAQAVPGLAGLLGRIGADAACIEPQIIGPCFCGPVACGVRIRRFVPVALVETTRAPGDSLLAPGLPGLGVAHATTSSALSTTDNTAEAHVWALPDGPLPGLDCLACGLSAARLPAPTQDAAAARCGPAAVVGQATQAAAANLGGPWLPHLAYASEIDLINWRTGCRDLFDPRSAALLLSPACGAGAGLEPGPARCLGQWGSLLPRQMRDIGPPPLLHSAKTAVRAMSIAREQIGSFPYPVDTDGKLQQVYPATGACFRVGQLPLPAQTSADGRHAWIYWRPVSCCVGYPAVRQCLGAH